MPTLSRGATLQFGTARLPGAACVGDTYLLLQDARTHQTLVYADDMPRRDDSSYDDKARWCSFGTYTATTASTTSLLLREDCGTAAPCGGTVAFSIREALVPV